ncbi:hypothetical protein BGC31_03000 [Komagataeibacter xylinus]|nr:hypothetical protein BGC31_03000 [Komagataeibacter xylinus]
MVRAGVHPCLAGTSVQAVCVLYKTRTKFTLDPYVSMQEMLGHGKEDMLMLHGFCPLLYYYTLCFFIT